MKELYYIRGDKFNQIGVQEALVNAGGIVEVRFSFTDDKGLYYIGEDSKIAYTIDGDNEITRLLKEYGTELKPVEPMMEREFFYAFDKVIAKCTNCFWTTDFFSYKTKDGLFKCGNDLYEECHRYEPYMKKYIGTNTPYKEFEKK